MTIATPYRCRDGGSTSATSASKSLIVRLSVARKNETTDVRLGNRFPRGHEPCVVATKVQKSALGFTTNSNPTRV